MSKDCANLYKNKYCSVKRDYGRPNMCCEDIKDCEVKTWKFRDCPNSFVTTMGTTCTVRFKLKPPLNWDRDYCRNHSNCVYKIDNNIQKIKEQYNKIIEHQNSENTHKLTCGNNSTHKLLRPDYTKDGVILYCVECNYTQTFIPEL